jgi:hypothetical protein
MKVLFLDIDGVLNSGEHTDLNRKDFPPFFYVGIGSYHVKFLNKIFDNVENLQIVLSSTWRLSDDTGFGGVSGTLKYLRARGYTGPDFIGVTPRMPLFFKPHLERWGEISKWMEDQSTPTESYVIIDDIDMTHYTDNQIKTDEHIGLTEELADKAIEILNKPKQP